MSRRLTALLGALALCTFVAMPLGGTALASTPKPTAKAIPAPPEAVGIYPTVVNFKDALRSGQYLETIGVLNGSSQGAYFHFNLSGTAAPWLHVVSSEQHLTPITELWAPNGAAPTTAVLELQVPATTADGTYTGLITVSSPPRKTTKKGQTAVGLGAQIGVTVAITGTEVVAAKLLNAFTFPKIEVGEQLPVFAVIKNLGNVSLQPRFHLEVTKATGRTAVFTWHGVGGAATLPGQTTTYQLEWPASETETQTLGKYTAGLTVSFPSGKRLGSWSLPFQLYPYGSLHRGGKLLSLKLSNRPALGGRRSRMPPWSAPVRSNRKPTSLALCTATGHWSRPSSLLSLSCSPPRTRTVTAPASRCPSQCPKMAFTALRDRPTLPVLRATPRLSPSESEPPRSRSCTRLAAPWWYWP